MSQDAGPIWHRIGDVARLLGETVPTLRWWERELAPYAPVQYMLRGHRWYKPEQLEQWCEIQRLLRVELYTTEGAKRQLRLALERSKGSAA